jgi:hypothetical protein
MILKEVFLFAWVNTVPTIFFSFLFTIALSVVRASSSFFCFIDCTRSVNCQVSYKGRAKNDLSILVVCAVVC